MTTDEAIARCDRLLLYALYANGRWQVHPLGGHPGTGEGWTLAEAIEDYAVGTNAATARTLVAALGLAEDAHAAGVVRDVS